MDYRACDSEIAKKPFFFYLNNLFLIIVKINKMIIAENDTFYNFMGFLSTSCIPRLI